MVQDGLRNIGTSKWTSPKKAFCYGASNVNWQPLMDANGTEETMEHVQARFRIRLPLVHFEKLSQQAKLRGFDSVIPIILEFLNWGFKAFCREMAQKISNIKGQIDFLELWHLVFEGQNQTHGITQHLSCLLPSACITNVQKNASIVTKAIAAKNIDNSKLRPIEESFLVLFFFRLRFDEFHNTKK